MKTKTFITAFLLPVFSSALKCFECDPREKTCVLPKAGTTNVTNCEGGSFQTTNPDAMLMTKTINNYSNSSVGDVLCYNLFFGIDTNQEGVYRGCARCNLSITNFCNELKGIMKDGNITYCHFCSTDNCNDNEFDSNIPEFKTRNEKSSKSLIPPKEVIDKASADASSITQSYKLMFIIFINIIYFLDVIQM